MIASSQTRNVAGLVISRASPFKVGSTNHIAYSDWTYDKLGRVVDQYVHTSTSQDVVRQTLSYFGNDDPKEFAHSLGTSTHTFGFAYDRRHQITNTSTGTGYFDADYSYGDAGRFTRVLESQTINPTPPGSELRSRHVDYVYGGADPEQVTALLDVGTGTTYASYEYDDAGDQVARCYGGPVASCTGEKTEYVYDLEGRLRRATKIVGGVVEGTEEYWYDHQGNRAALVKRDDTGAKTELVWFIGDTEAHYNGTGTLTRVYSNISMGGPTVARVSRTASSTSTIEHQYHGLANNTIAALAYINGTINASFSYSPFGAVLESTSAGGRSNGTGVHKRRFNDKYVDDLTELTYYGARYYDKTLLGWTQSDPLFRFEPDRFQARPRSALLYTFTENNPLRYLDPDGLCAVLACFPDVECAQQCAAEPKPAWNVLTALNVVARGLDIAGQIAADLAGEKTGPLVDFGEASAEAMLNGEAPPAAGGDVPFPPGPGGGGLAPPPGRGGSLGSNAKPSGNKGQLSETVKVGNNVNIGVGVGSKPKAGASRQPGDRMSEGATLGDALDQLGGVERAQKGARKARAGDATVQSTKKSEQNVQNRLNRIKSKDDIGDDDMD